MDWQPHLAFQIVIDSVRAETDSMEAYVRVGTSPDGATWPSTPVNAVQVPRFDGPVQWQEDTVDVGDVGYDNPCVGTLR